MKTKFIVPILLLVFLAGPVAIQAQNSKEKKIKRELREIERHSKKLQKLQGGDYSSAGVGTINDEQIAKIREEARAQANEAREQVREAMQQQKEAMREQREAMKEQREAAMDQKREAEQEDVETGKIERDNNQEKGETEISVEKNINGKKYHYYYKTPKFEYKTGEPTVINVPKFKFKEGEPIVIDVPEIKIDSPEFRGKTYSILSDYQDNLSINKSLTDESSTADFNYEVKKGVESMKVNVSGAIDAGKVKIVIKRPDGEAYNEYTLSPLANVNWKQSINFEDLKETEYLGKWTVTVSAENAKGNYSVQLSGR